MEFSIYRLSTTRDNYIEFLIQEYGMGRVGVEQASEIQKLVDGQVTKMKTRMDFFFKSEDDTVDIEWFNYWKGFFQNAEQKSKIVDSAYGIITIEIDGELYAISLGRAHSIANNFADMDFGFDIAEIIHDNEKIDVKSAKFFKQSKNKSLTQYNRNSYVTTEIGESHEMLISKIVFPEKYSQFILSNYEEGVKFGSTVKINISGYRPHELIEIVTELHYLLTNEEKTGSLPRMNFLKNNEDNQPIIADLNRRLLDAIMTDDVRVSLSYYFEDDGLTIVEPSNDEKIEIIFASKRHEIESYTIKSIGKKLSDIGCDDVTKVSFKTSSTKISIIKILDYSTNIRNKDYCLFKGKWASFNKSYIEFIGREIIKVNQIARYDEAYNLTDDILEVGRQIQNSDKEKYDSGVKYAEYPFNIFLQEQFNYELLDRKKGQHFYKNVEFADLYDNTQKSLIHLKIGDTASLRYCIQQSLHSAELYNSQSNVLNPYGITEVKKITMIFVVSTSNLIGKDKQIDFSKNGSMYFLIEIIEWLTKIRTLGFTPEIFVAKDMRVSKGKDETGKKDGQVGSSPKVSKKLKVVKKGPILQPVAPEVPNTGTPRAVSQRRISPPAPKEVLVETPKTILRRPVAPKNES